MPLPEITHLQYLVLEFLLRNELAGAEIREKLSDAGEKKSGPAFYQLMSRLEESNFVEGWYDKKIVSDQIIKERRYRITGEGSSAYDTTTAFYLARRNLGLLGI